MKEKIYVALSGNDSNKGLIDSPLKTPVAARDKAKAIVDSGFSGEIEIIFREGVYEFKNTFEITKEYSGNESVKIKYCAYENEEVCFTGGITVEGKEFVKLTDEDIYGRVDENAKDKILCLDLKKFSDLPLEHQKKSGFAQDIIPSANELFVDNKALSLGGFPKKGHRKTINDIVFHGNVYRPTEDPALSPYKNADPYASLNFTKEDYPIIRYDFPEADKWGNAKDAMLLYVEGFIDATYPLEYIDTKRKEIHFGDYAWSSVHNDNYTSSFKVFNLLEEVTTPNEYYIDRERGIVFYYPDEDFSEKSKVQISYLKEPVVAVEDCKNIEFENIIFENTRGMAIYSDNSEKLVIRNCVFRNIGMVAVSLGLGFEETKTVIHNATLKPKRRVVGGLKAHMWDNHFYNRQAGKNNLIIGCEIYNIGCGGVIIDGGDRASLTPGNTHVVDCDIHDYNRIDQTYRPGVRIFGVGNSVSFCKIHSAPQQAVEIMGNDIWIAYNEIYDCCLDSYDNGAVYIGSWPFSTNSFNTNIVCNYFHNNCSNDNKYIGVSGMRSETYDVYLDGHPGTNAYMNVFDSSKASEAMFINADSLCNNFYNNVFVNVSGLLYNIRTHEEYAFGLPRTRSYDPFRFFNLSEENTKIWKERYPVLEKYKDMTLIPYCGHKFNNNIHFGKGHMIRGSSMFYEYNNNYHFNKAEYVNDPKTSDYIFDENSPVLKKCTDFVNIPVKYIANYKLYREENK